MSLVEVKTEFFRGSHLFLGVKTHEKRMAFLLSPPPADPGAKKGFAETAAAPQRRSPNRPGTSLVAGEKK